jgi:hypothetical protein
MEARVAMRRFIRIVGSLCIAALVLGCTRSAHAQTPDASVGAALRNLASRSGLVFVGRVTAVSARGGVVEVSFAVEQPVLGSVGASYTLREWAGLWAAGQPRYRVGQRAMFFLHPPNAAGLSSPVDGMEGVVPVVATAANQPRLLDVRRLAARAQRKTGLPLDPPEKSAIALNDAAGCIAAWRSPGPEPKRLPLPIAMPPEPVDALR